jgi:hypothetical protein
MKLHLTSAAGAMMAFTGCVLAAEPEPAEVTAPDCIVAPVAQDEAQAMPPRRHGAAHPGEVDAVPTGAIAATGASSGRGTRELTAAETSTLTSAKGLRQPCP